MYLRLTFPSTMLIQNTNDIGKILLQRSSGSTVISGLSFSTLITTYPPMAEQMKWMQDTDSGNLKSNFCKREIKKKNLNLKDLLQSIQIEKLINVEGAMKSDIPLSSKIEKEHKTSKQS